MYATVILITIPTLLALLIAHFAVRGRSAACAAPPAGHIGYGLYFLVLLSTLVAAVSAWTPIVLWSQAMRGWLLLIHSAAAGLFVVALASMVLFWAGGCRVQAQPDAAGRAFSCGQKAAFWLAAGLGLLVILTSLLPMTPLLGTHEQELSITTHRYAGLGLVLVLMIHRYLMWLASRRSRTTQGAIQHAESA